MKKICFSVLFMIFFFSSPFYAQKVSEKKDVAVFATSYYGWYIPNEFIDLIDESIVNVFFNLERFNIIGLEYRLNSKDVDTFTEIIKQSREADTPLPEEVLMGLEAFTKEDWEKTVNSYYVAVPIIKSYSIEKVRYTDLLFGEIDGYRANLNLEFHVYSSQEDLREKISISVSTEDKSYDKVFSSALGALSSKLNLELRKIKAFTIKTGIIKAEKNTVHFELGKKMGVKLGDEYVVLSGDGLKEIGLIVVTKIENDFSKGLVLYTKTPLNLGDQIKEVPHGPFEYRTYILGEAGILDNRDIVHNGAFTIGINASATRGFYRIRPCFGMEFTIDSQFIKMISVGAPLSIFGGAEIGNTYFKRLQILPTVQFYYTMIIGGSKNNIHIPAGTGIRTFVHTGFLVTKNIKIGGDLGMRIGASLFNGGSFILRLTAGLGVTIKI